MSAKRKSSGSGCCKYIVAVVRCCQWCLFTFQPLPISTTVASCPYANVYIDYPKNWIDQYQLPVTIHCPCTLYCSNVCILIYLFKKKVSTVFMLSPPRQWASRTPLGNWGTRWQGWTRSVIGTTTAFGTWFHQAAKIEHFDIVVKCMKWLEQVHIGEWVWVKAKVRW